LLIIKIDLWISKPKRIVKYVKRNMEEFFLTNINAKDAFEAFVDNVVPAKKPCLQKLTLKYNNIAVVIFVCLKVKALPIT